MSGAGVAVADYADSHKATIAALVQRSAGVILARVPAWGVGAEAVSWHRSLGERAAALLGADHIQRRLQQAMRLWPAIRSGAPAGSQQLLPHQRQFPAILGWLQGQAGGSHTAIEQDGRTGAQEGDVVAQLTICLAELLVRYECIQIVATRIERLVDARQIVLAHHNAQLGGVARLGTEETVCSREQIVTMNYKRRSLINVH